jgi:hypothetical protein
MKMDKVLKKGVGGKDSDLISNIIAKFGWKGWGK